MASEFDDYAKQYEDLLNDPIRSAFTSDDHFFAERKWILLQSFYLRHGLDARSHAWLDVGCGKGDLLKLGRESFRHVAGCDPSAEMLGACGDLPVERQPSPDRLPYPAESFDLVTAVCVYHHVDAPLRPGLTAEVMRVLRPGGAFCMIEHNPLNPATQIIIHRTPVDADAHLLTSGASRRLLRSSGFGRLETEFFLWLPQNMYRRFGNLESWLTRVPLGGQYAAFGRKPS